MERYLVPMATTLKTLSPPVGVYGGKIHKLSQQNLEFYPQKLPLKPSQNQFYGLFQS